MDSNPVKVLTIFHTSDIHGKWDFEKVKKIQDILDNCDTWKILVDSGDIMKGGNLLFYPFENTFNYINKLKYTAICLGNREFNYFRSVFYSRLKRYSFLACNLVDKFSKGKKIEPALHFVFKNSNEDSLRITIIGFTKTQYPEKSFWTSLTGFVFRDIFKSLDEQFQKYYKITDLFIILSHLGIEDDKLLAKYIYDNYLDKYFIILGGHEHKEFFDDEFVPLIHTPPFLEKITKIELIFKGSKEKILENVFLHRIDL